MSLFHDRVIGIVIRQTKAVSTIADCKPDRAQAFGGLINMTDDEAQAVWRDYYRRIRNRRLDEAEQLIAVSRSDGITDQSEMFLDFRHFSLVEADIEQLKQQLAENYDVSVSKDQSKDYWYLDGTTRPVQMAFQRDQLIGWVEFMASVAQSYACVFSAWVLTQASTGKQWATGSFEAATE